MIKTIETILTFDISDDKKIELIRALVKPEVKTNTDVGFSYGGVLNDYFPSTYCGSGGTGLNTGTK